MKPLSRREAVLHVMNALAGYWPDAHVEAAPASVLVALPTGQQLDLRVSITPASVQAACERDGQDCLSRLAGGWITASDLCGPCTGRFMAALDQVGTEPLSWHQKYRSRAGES